MPLHNKSLYAKANDSTELCGKVLLTVSSFNIDHLFRAYALTEARITL